MDHDQPRRDGRNQEGQGDAKLTACHQVNPDVIMLLVIIHELTLKASLNAGET